MTNEKAIERINGFILYFDGVISNPDNPSESIEAAKEDKEALEMAIKALDQETVSKESYDHEYFLRKEFELKIDKLQRQLEEQAVKEEPILDKIRAEIKTKDDSIPWRNNDYDDGWVEALEWVLDDVIDKYKTESE